MAFLYDEQGRMVRKDGSLVDMSHRTRRKGPRRTPVRKTNRWSHLKVDAILGPDGAMRDEYERLLETPNTYLKHLHKWFADRGHKLTISAIRRHRDRHFEQWTTAREATRMAEAFCKVTGEHGPDAVLRAAQGQAEMTLMQDLFEIKKGGVEPAKWERWVKVLGGMASSRLTVEEAGAVVRKHAKEIANAADRASLPDIAERVRDILGA